MLLDRVFKLNKRLNKFYFCSAKYWKGKYKKSFKRHICCFNFFSFFLDLISSLFFLF